MFAKAWIVAGAALLAFDTPAHAATFSVNISSPVGTPSCGFVAVGPSNTPVARELVCGPPLVPGGHRGAAAASFGHVGAGSRAFHNGGFGSAVTSAANFRDFVTFTSTDPNVQIITVGGMNLAFSGVMNATEHGNASVVATLVFGSRFLFEANHNGVTRNDFQTIGGSVSGSASDALLRSGAFDVFVNQSVNLEMGISAGAGVLGNSDPQSARSDFSNSLEIPFGMDVFVLPPGVTANAGDWLVNNRRVGGPVSPIPEPSTWALMIAGFGLAGASLRRRRRRPIVLA